MARFQLPLSVGGQRGDFQPTTILLCLVSASGSLVATMGIMGKQAPELIWVHSLQTSLPPERVFGHAAGVGGVTDQKHLLREGSLSQKERKALWVLYSLGRWLPKKEQTFLLFIPLHFW